MKKVLIWSVCLTVVFFAIHFVALLLGWLKPWVGVGHLIYPTAIAFGVLFIGALYLRCVAKRDRQTEKQ